MPEFEKISNQLARCRKNRAFFMFLFSMISLVIWQRSSFPTQLYALVSGIIFLAISAYYFRTYLTWNFGARSDEELIAELKKAYTSKKIIDGVSSLSIEEVDRIAAEESGWLESYAGYVKFGLLWGILYAASLLIRVHNFGSIDDWMASIFFNSVMLFVLGKSIADIAGARIESGLARVSAAHFFGYAPFFMLAGFFGDRTFFDAPLAYAEEIAVRILLIAAAAFIYKIAGSDLPE